jgi:hypothetical protein
MANTNPQPQSKKGIEPSKTLTTKKENVDTSQNA